MELNAIDLFAGPGGTDLGAQAVGIDPLGIELDADACATRKAAGLRTYRGDVAEFSPEDFASERAGGPIDLLMASPPCQSFSMAGDRKGHDDIDLIRELTVALARGEDLRSQLRSQFADERSILVVEPLRWALALRPRWIMLEQVPPVLPYWREVARVLEAEGWLTWAGVLEAERYGVPQTRERAILLADRERQPHPPQPTHQRYVPGEPARHDVTLEGEIEPWVSMAEALGWGMTARPYPVIASSRTTGGPDREKVGGSGARAQIYEEQEAGRWKLRHSFAESSPESWTDHELAADERPAPTVDTKARSWERTELATHANTRPNEGEHRERPDGLTREGDKPAPTVDGRAAGWERRKMVNGNQENAAVRDEDEPAPTVAFGHNAARVQWTEDRPAPTVVGSRRSEDGMLVGRQLPEGEGKNIGGKNWTEGRPASTVTADSRIFASERKQRNPDYQPGDDAVSAGHPGNAAVRVSIQEAAVLQGFPPDYPWQGSRTEQFSQCGNAVCPPLAKAILKALIG